MDAYTGEIRLFAGNYAPLDWAYCNGQEISVQQYTALYSLITNTYGGTPGVTFKLPDLRGKVPMGTGTGPGLSERDLGVTYGSASASVTLDQMPAHTHVVRGKLTPGATVTNDPTGHIWANLSVANKVYTTTPNETMDPRIVAPMVGGGNAHNNVQPCVAINYIICLNGNYPDFD